MHTPLRYFMCSVHGLHVFRAVLCLHTRWTTVEVCRSCSVACSWAAWPMCDGNAKLHQQQRLRLRRVECNRWCQIQYSVCMFMWKCVGHAVWRAHGQRGLCVMGMQNCTSSNVCGCGAWNAIGGARFSIVCVCSCESSNRCTRHCAVYPVFGVWCSCVRCCCVYPQYG